MRVKWLGLAFPIAIVGLMAAERLSTFLLGSHPNSAILWEISLELRSIFRNTAQWLEAASGGIMSLQLGALLAIGLALLATAAMRHSSTISFVINHAMLLLVGAAALMATGGTLASASNSISAPTSLILIGSQRFDALHYTLLIFGLLGCAACHYSFLSEKAARQRPIALSLRELALNLEGRRAVR